MTISYDHSAPASRPTPQPSVNNANCARPADFLCASSQTTIENAIIAKAQVSIDAVPSTHTVPEKGQSDNRTRVLLLAVRQGMIILLGAVEDYLDMERSIIPKHRR